MEQPNNKPHQFAIGINSEVDGIEAAAESAARAVNRYLATVTEGVAVETSVVVSIGADAEGVGEDGAYMGFVDTNDFDPNGDFADDDEWSEENEFPDEVPADSDVSEREVD